MAFGHLRRYDVQAKYALVASLVSVPPLVGTCWLVMSRFNAELQQIVYGSGGKFVPALFGCILLSSIPAFGAFVLGWNSAGQRRNDKSTRSWIAFFVGGTVVTCNVIVLIAFYWLGLKQVT